MKDSVIILSGGMDSVTLLYDQYERIALAVTFDYGSKHNAREIPFARLHCQRLGIRHIVIPLGFMTTYFKSSLLQGGDDIPEGHYADDNMRSTVVPFRNGIMLSVAIGLADSNGLRHVMMANHGGDHTIYPDCRPEFVSAMSEAARTGTAFERQSGDDGQSGEDGHPADGGQSGEVGHPADDGQSGEVGHPGVTLLCPFTHLTKAQIALRGRELGIDYSETWSCYKGGERHCGRCGTCVERHEALVDAGIPDPTDYAYTFIPEDHNK